MNAPTGSSRVTVRVRFCETDLMGIVHHASYLAYFELARVEWLRRRGVTYAEWAAQGLHLPVVEATLRYRAPARFDDLLTVEVTLDELRSASLRFGYRVLRRDEVLVEGMTRLACVDAHTRVRRMDEAMTTALTAPETPGYEGAL